MACNRFKARTDPVATGTSAKTILQVVAAANHAVRIDEISIAFQGQTNTAAPIQVDYIRQTNAGTLGTSTSTIKKDPSDWGETMQTSILDGGTGYSAEPSAGDILRTEFVHPQQGYTWQAPYGREIKISGGGRLGIRVTAGASVNCVVTVYGEE